MGWHSIFLYTYKQLNKYFHLISVGTEICFEIHKKHGWTGISIASNFKSGKCIVPGIYVQHVARNSPADYSKQLFYGDRILEINSQDVREASCDKVMEMIFQSGKTFQLTIQPLFGARISHKETSTAKSNKVKGDFIKVGGFCANFVLIQI